MADADYPRDRTLHELILDTAARRPDAVAVELDGGGRLTYAELEERSGRVAARLHAEGIGPGALVGVLLERSLDLAVALLGVMRSGAAYVPLDPAYPEQRLELMLEDSGAAVVIAHAETAGAVPGVAPRVLRMDELGDAGGAGAPSRNGSAPPKAGPEDLAYVIYTSGSTGRPKGVMIPHRALCNFAWTIRATPGISKDDTLVSVTTPCFDIFGLELYVPLVAGGRVVIAARQTTGDARLLAALLESTDATVMQATPATWRLLIESGWEGRPGLRALCGGEALPAALADRLVERCAEVWNMFGPTKTTIWSTCIRLESGEPPIPIGRPIANTGVHVIDEDGTQLEPGQEGELYIGGDGLAHGYFQRPELTAERFVEHPALGRLYRTGDLVRMRPDGVLDYLGRLDHQVKIRGYRIELGEIEVVLERDPAVAHAVVVARESPAGEKELVAYVVTADGSAPDVRGLRRAVAEVLPEYMVPALVVGLDEMPLTPNGKVDRKALPEPTRERGDDAARVAPRTPLERRLVAIWEHELGIRPIGVTDNFFDLGVSSLTAARLFARIEHELGDKLPLGAMFRAPTVATLAILLEQGDDAPQWTSLVPIQPHGTRPPIFCVHGGAGTVLLLEPLARALGGDQPFYALQARGLYGDAPPLLTVEEMAAHYLAELRSVQPSGPYHLAGYCFGSIVAFEMAQMLLRDGEEIASLVVLSGPSATWIRKWGWRGNQPSVRPRILARMAERDDWGLTRRERLARVLRDPRRLLRPVRRKLSERAVERALANGRPIPEEARERFFLGLHSRAERAYHESSYPGELVVFYGDRLYEDPELGWGPFAAGGVVTHAIAGDHLDNRDLLKGQAVRDVAALLQEYVDARAVAGAGRAVADAG